MSRLPCQSLYLGLSVASVDGPKGEDPRLVRRALSFSLQARVGIAGLAAMFFVVARRPWNGDPSSRGVRVSAVLCVSAVSTCRQAATRARTHAVPSTRLSFSLWVNR